MNDIFILENCVGKKLDSSLKDIGVNLIKSCSGKGLCQSCSVKILEGQVSVGDKIIAENNTVKSCQATIKSDYLKVESLKKNQISNIENTFNLIKDLKIDNLAKDKLAVVVDIGTTTVASILCDMHTGKILENTSSLNPQTKFGDDVLSRIDFANTPENLKKLHIQITNLINEHIRTMQSKHKIDVVDLLLISGNTTMLHLFFNEDPSGMGKSPWTPKFLESKICGVEGVKEYFGDVAIKKLVSLPSISAFVGADLSSACAVIDILNEKENILLIDVGTNAEILLKYEGKLYSTSAAAGPTLEGYLLTSAIRAYSGAISKFEIENDEIKFQTIDNLKPIGICGSGYIDFISVAKDLDIVNSFGRLDKSKKNVITKESKTYYAITDNIVVSEEDISNILKAKGAIYAAIQTLFEKFDIDEGDIDKCYISGGFGKNINIKNAINIKMLPELDLDKFKYLGNSSLAGAYICALDKNAISKLKDIDKKFENIELNKEENFEDNYIDSLMLD